MASHKIALWSVAIIVYTVLTWNIYGSIATTNDYLLVVIASNGSGYVFNYEECDANGATFGRQISADETLTGCPVAASPRYGCDAISPPPSPSNSSFECIGGYFAVLARGNCSFAQKAFRAQTAGYTGVIIYNNANYPLPMETEQQFGPKVLVPTFSVGFNCGMALSDRYSYFNGFAFYVRVYWSYPEMLRYLIPFVSVIGICFLVMLSAMVIKLIRDRRKIARRRLSKKHLKQIPTRKFVAGDDPETCPICLDDFEVGDRLRVLPCGHTYHSNCIDPWLLKNRRVCPICKRKVLPKAPGSAHSDSDTEETSPETAAGPSAEATTPERTPLLNHVERSVTIGNSTFYGMYDTSDDPAPAPDRDVPNNPTPGSPAGTPRPVVLPTATTSDNDSESTPEDPTVDVDNRQSLIPQLSIQSSMDECSQPGFITASSSFREGYANPNFVVDAHEFDVDIESGASSVAGTGEKRGPRNEMV